MFEIGLLQTRDCPAPTGSRWILQNTASRHTSRYSAWGLFLLVLTGTPTLAAQGSPLVPPTLLHDHAQHSRAEDVLAPGRMSRGHLYPAAKTVSASQVTIAGFAFNPGKIIIKAGQTVTWTNRDAVQHTVTGQKGDWDSGNLATGASFSHTFTQPGIYDYVCAIHPNMTGEVIVQ